MGYTNSDDRKAIHADSAVNQFMKQLWNQTDTFDVEQVERTGRIGNSLEYSDYDSVQDSHNAKFTSDSGTDKGGSNQNWFKD
jgi:hypothetical protein